MLKKALFVLTVFISIIFLSCNSVPKETPAPDWFVNTEAVYPDSQYIAIIGEGFSKPESLAAAEQELGKYFGQNVKSTVTATEEWSGNDKEGYVNNKNLNKEYTITFDVDLFAVKKTKPWYNADTGSFFVCAYIDRESAFEMYRPTIIKARTDFHNFYNDSIDETDLYKKLDWLEETDNIGTQYLNVLNFAQCIKPSAADIYKKDIEAISEIKNELKAIQIEVSKRPDWIDSTEKVYPESVYIARIGEGATRHDAIANGEQELAKHFGQRIQSKVTATEEWSGNNKEGYVNNKNLNKEYIVSFDVELFAVKKTMPWYNTSNNTYYICTYINRQEAMNKYNSTLQTARTDFYNFYNKSKEETNLIKKIEWLNETKIIGAQYKEVLDFAQGLDSSIYETYKEDFNAIAEVDNLLKEAKIEAYKQPDWVATPGKVYPDSKYIARVGEGYSRDAALTKAEQELAKYFGQNVQSTITSIDSWTGNDKDGYTNSKTLNNEAVITVDIDLFAVDKTQPWLDPDTDTYYICAFIDRNKAFNLYKPNIDTAKIEFHDLLNKGKEEDNLIKKVEYFEETKKLCEPYKEKLIFAVTLNPDAYETYKEDFNAIAEVDNLLKEAKIEAYKQPDWVATPGKVYPDSKYIARVGEGYSKDAALTKAEQELAKYFGQNVQSTVTSSDSWTGNDKDGYTNSKTLNNEAVITANTDLFAVEKTYPWYNQDTDTYYICAYIDREKAFNLYKPKISTLMDEFYNLYNIGINEPDLFKKIEWLEQSKPAGQKLKDTLDSIIFIYPDAYSIYENELDNIASIDGKVKEARNAIYSMKIIVNKDYGNKIYDNISKIISNNGFTVSNNRYSYILSVDVDENMDIDEFSEIIAATPSITISLKNKLTNEVSFTYTKEMEKVKGFSENKVKGKIFDEIRSELDNSFEYEVKDFFYDQIN